MEPISLTVAAIVAAVAAKASDRATDAVVEGGEGALRRVVERVRDRFTETADEDASKALELVEQVPDSKRLVEGLAVAVDRHVVDEPAFAGVLDDLAEQARASGVDVEAITQNALGDQVVQIAGVTSSTITVTHAVPRPGKPTD
jgi:post-segregation antitoxin (ccd killing protein)